MKKGFTLIELLVVIGIIGALAGFAISKLGSADKALAVASVKQDVRSAVSQDLINKSMGMSLEQNTEGVSENNDGTQTQAMEVTIIDPASASGTDALYKVQISPRNNIRMRSIECGDDSDRPGEWGYYAWVKNTKYTHSAFGDDGVADIAWGFTSCGSVAIGPVYTNGEGSTSIGGLSLNGTPI